MLCGESIYALHRARSAREGGQLILLRTKVVGFDTSISFHFFNCEGSEL